MTNIKCTLMSLREGEELRELGKLYYRLASLFNLTWKILQSPVNIGKEKFHIRVALQASLVAISILVFNYLCKLPVRLAALDTLAICSSALLTASEFYSISCIRVLYTVCWYTSPEQLYSCSKRTAFYVLIHTLSGTYCSGFQLWLLVEITNILKSALGNSIPASTLLTFTAAIIS